MRPCLAALAAAVACGDAGAPLDAAPPIEQATAAELYGLAVGAAWSWRRTEDGDLRDKEIVACEEVARRDPASGALAVDWAYVRENRAEDGHLTSVHYLAERDGAVVRLRRDDLVRESGTLQAIAEYVPFNPRLMAPPYVAGREQAFSYLVSGPEPVEVSGVLRVLGERQVDVPAGHFLVLAIERRVAGQPGATRSYYAPGVGEVLEEYLFSDGRVSRTEELRDARPGWGACPP